jgi:hypothetical protein
MVYFRNENNYVDLYRYLDNFIALYLTEGFNCTMGNDIRHRPESHTYSECDRGNMVFIHPEYVNWGPEYQDKTCYERFSVSTFNENVLSHDYHLHQHRERTEKPYCLNVFLKQRGSEPESAPPPASRNHKCSPIGDSDNLSNLFGID